jgi:hypothetical protein
MLISTVIAAETPNLQPGLWSYTTTTTVEGPLAVPAQTTNNEECLTQAQVNKGIDMLELPAQCAVVQADVMRDSSNFTLSCDMQGIQALFNGQTQFHGDHMQGNMLSEMNTPLGVMLMKMDFVSKRVGDCPAS